MDYLHEVSFQKCGLGRTILGPAENVRSLTREQLQDYITTHYTAPRMVVVGAGALEHDRLVEMADKCFGNLPRHPPHGAIVTVRAGTEEEGRGGSTSSRCCAVAVTSGSWSPGHVEMVAQFVEWSVLSAVARDFLPR